jgi:hypothetical protein
LAASYQGTVLSAFQDVANALYAVDADSRALQMSQDSESASQTTWKLSDSQLKAGYASMPTALAAKQSWLQAQAARVAAKAASMVMWWPFISHSAEACLARIQAWTEVDIASTRCTVPGSHGAFFSLEQEKALWQSACMAAPARRRVSAQNSS